MKRFRGPLLIVLTVVLDIPVWFYFQRLAAEARKTPFGAEFGSVAGPLPLWLSVVKLVLLVSLISGFVLLVVDLIEWPQASKRA
jgi:hypothetical protein